MLQTSHLFNQLHGSDKSFTGYKYLLDDQSTKRITEALGLTANYACTYIKIACLDLYQDKAIMWLEIAKNAKPNDLALRYLAERWSLGARKEKQPDGQSFITYIYQTEHLPDDVLKSLADEIKLALDDVHSLFIRIDCKDNAAILLKEEKSDQQLPSGFIEQVDMPSEQLYSGQTIILEHEIPPTEPNVVPDSVEANATDDAFNKDDAHMENLKKEEKQQIVMKVPQTEMPNIPVAKYATYSRSEVDLLLKQQSESIASTLNSKISSQQKLVAELIKNKEKEFKQDQENLKIYIDESEEKLKKSHQANQKQIEGFLDQSKKALADESEQFKAYLNKSILPTLKSLDGKVISIVTNYLDEQAKTKTTEKKLNVGTLIAYFALGLALINIVLLVVLYLKH